jgi:hypothetical protein
MRARRKRGRCNCPGASHSNCIVTQELRSPVSRHHDTQDIHAALQEAELEIQDTLNGEIP